MTKETQKLHRRRSFLKLTGGTLAACMLSPSISRGSSTSRPNIVLIIADDWAHMDLGSAGHPLLS